MANIFQHTKRGLKAYQLNLMPYMFSFASVILAVFSIALFGMLTVLYNSESVLYSDQFLNSSANMDMISLVMAIITPANALILVTFFTLALLAGVYLSSGIYGVCLEGARGTTSVKTFYRMVMRRGGPYLLASLTLFVLWSLLLVALIFPIVVFANLILPSLASVGTIYSVSLLVIMLVVSPLLISVPISVVWGRGIADSFKQSFSIGRENYFEMLALIAMMAAVSISLAIIPVVGLLVQIFVVVPVSMFTLCSYYLDKASIKRGFESKSNEMEGGLAVESVLPKARKIREVKAKIISPANAPSELPEKIVPEKKPAGVKPKVVIIRPGASKKGKRKASVYVVARKRPVRLKLPSQRKKAAAMPAKSRAKKAARKPVARKAKKGRKAA